MRRLFYLFTFLLFITISGFAGKVQPSYAETNSTPSHASAHEASILADADRSSSIYPEAASATGSSDYSVFLPLVIRVPAPEVDFASQVIALTNEYRAQNGCAPLKNSELLAAAAQRHSNDMASNNFVDHTGSDGSSPWYRIQAAGYVFSEAAENVAAGHPSPEDVVEGWMDSPGHRANILDCDLMEIGVGYSQSDTATYVHYWTQDFGTPQ